MSSSTGFSVSRTLAVAERDCAGFETERHPPHPHGARCHHLPRHPRESMGPAISSTFRSRWCAVTAARRRAEVVNRCSSWRQSRELFRLGSEPDPTTAVDRLRAGDYKASWWSLRDSASNSSRASPRSWRGRGQHRHTSAAVIEGELRAAFARGWATSASAAAAVPEVHVERVDV